MTKQFNIEHDPKSGYTLRVPLTDAQAENIREQVLIAKKFGNGTESSDSDVLMILMRKSFDQKVIQVRASIVNRDIGGVEQLGQVQQEARDQIGELQGSDE